MGRFPGHRREFRKSDFTSRQSSKNTKKTSENCAPHWGNARHFSKMNFPNVFGSVLHSVKFRIASSRRVSAEVIEESWPSVVRETVSSPCLHPRSRRVLTTVRLRDASPVDRLGIFTHGPLPVGASAVPYSSRRRTRHRHRCRDSRKSPSRCSGSTRAPRTCYPS